MRLKPMTALAALIALPAQALAQPGCLTRGEAESLVTALLPSLILHVGAQCAPVLAPDAALVERGDALAERYRPAAEEARPVAAPVAARFLDDGEDPPFFPEGTAEEIALSAFEVGIATGISLDARGCRIADGVFGALEPLPARNFAALIALFMEIGAAEGADEPDGTPPFRVCGADEG